jgi:hypothetical protein
VYKRQVEIVNPDPQICVFADRSRLIQLIFNLIDSGIALMKRGVIKLSTTEVTIDSVKIEIDFECPVTLWQESNPPEPDFQTHDLAEIRQLLQEITLSANMKLLLSKTLLETMGGSLELKELNYSNEEQSSSRLILTCKRAV